MFIFEKNHMIEAEGGRDMDTQKIGKFIAAKRKREPMSFFDLESPLLEDE